MTIHLALVNGRMRGEISSDHVSSDHLAAFLDGRLTGAERERAVRHFAGCNECRQELTELRVVLGSVRRPGSRRWVVVATATAAILTFMMLPRGGDDTPEGKGARVRAESGLRLPDEPAIAVVSPADQSTVRQSGVALVWRSAGVGATYSLTVQDSSGGEVWRRVNLVDTSITVPDSVRLRPGHLYFWSVDARLGDGGTAKTGARTFIVR
jgi:hypothetical protein